MECVLEAAENTFKVAKLSKIIPLDVVCADLCSFVPYGNLPGVRAQCFVRLCTLFDTMRMQPSKREQGNQQINQCVS